MSDRMRSLACRIAAVIAIVAMCGCATKASVVLLPEADGKPTAVSVRHGASQIVLDQPYAAAEVRTVGVRRAQSNAQDVEARFGPAIAAQPARPQTFVLYF